MPADFDPEFPSRVSAQEGKQVLHKKMSAISALIHFFGLLRELEEKSKIPPLPPQDIFSIFTFFSFMLIFFNLQTKNEPLKFQFKMLFKTG
ncbi:MAG: hypothetical protein A2Y00_05830 [Omnitrophica WOR_2 bacterium GWF2_43_52]|nr:MAG: hypothetical protein A2Y00_05830 [Omnitrophica WOR_2 bacterium GWF2_43_52]OGX59047.1 MAG: hypothetical protein A2460_01585 [Omnitrophica WOR_2 bacterium RIFOXYC2_FULL_43_9]HAH21562.1 hypothetical protein [Candidatus Omnitrophota bacterium]HCD37210.1 hypothetical protein [Candidatus Omnitrophota bacterium]